MQNTHDSSPKTSVLSKKLFLGFKWGIFVVILVILFKTFQQKEHNIKFLIIEFSRISIRENAFRIILVILLLFANWGFEAKKWQILVNKIEIITFIDAYQSVLVGLSLGFITPANLGDYAGRILRLKSQKRSEGIGVIILGNGIQFYTALLFGVISYLQIFSKKVIFMDKIIFTFVIFLIIIGIVVYINRFNLTKYLKRFSIVDKYQNHLEALTTFDSKEFKQVFFWAILRYLTFSLQFVIVLQIFQVNIPLLDLSSVSCLVFLFKTIIPTINFLSDLGVREFSAIYFFSLYSVNISSVIMATFVLWLLNILLPVLVGAGLFLKIRSIK